MRMDPVCFADAARLLAQKPAVHFIGIGGVSMSGLAAVMLSRGCSVSGSDRSESGFTRRLAEWGARVSIGHDAANLQGTQLVVYTAAIPADNPELVAAREQGIPTLERASFLGLLMRDYTCPIGISGTHGKTTTTAMTATAMLKAGLDPTVMVGANVSSIGGNFRVGGQRYFVFEACEYVDSFLSFYPKVAVILNVEEDHLDYFADLAAIQASFRKFAEKVLPDGFVVWNADDPNSRKTLEGFPGRLVSFGLDTPDADFTARPDGDGLRIFHRGEELGRLTLRIPGRHNRMDALACVATLCSCGLSFEAVAEALADFTGAERRFEFKGETAGIRVYDDYSHHPSEITTALNAARSLNPGRLVVLFQPHTYSRTKAFFSEFAQALALADRTFLLPVYAARETPDSPYFVTSEQLAAQIPGAAACDGPEDAVKQLKSFLQPGDLVITMGAGDVFRCAPALLNALNTL